MNAGAKEHKIQRILVALDASSHSLSGLEAAIALAVKLDIEILGVYVEDINLLRLAEMPFARELGQFSARSRKLDTGQLERQLRIQADSANLALKQAAEAAGVSWSFRVLRGSIPAELIAATREYDLIILGQRGLSNFAPVGSTAQTIVSQSKILTLVLREGIRLGSSVLAIFDGTAAAGGALRFASSFAMSREGRLVVALIAPDANGAEELRLNVGSWGRKTGLPITFHWLKDFDANIICTIAQAEESGVLIIPKDSPTLTNETVLAILVNIDCPVMFVRQPEER